MAPGTRAYVGLGANIDEPLDHLRRALADLDHPPAARLVRVSRPCRSPPLGGQDQPAYWNAVAEIETGLEPGRLLSWFHAIEYRHGRRRGPEHWAPRPLDLDLLLYGTLVRTGPDPVLPHPGLASRAFVLYPLREIAPGLEIPGLGSLEALCARSSPHDLVFLDDWPR